MPLIISHSLYEPHIRESLRRIAGLKILKIIKPLKLQEKNPCNSEAKIPYNEKIYHSHGEVRCGARLDLFFKSDSWGH